MKYLKNITVIILMIIILIILSLKTEATTGKINVETVNIRKGPSTDSEIVNQLNKDDELEILEEENGWYKVNVNLNGENLEGYISKKLIDVVEEEQPATSTEETNTIQEDTAQANNSDIQSEPKPIEEPLTDIDPSEDIQEEKEYILQQEVGIKILPLMSSIEKAKISGKIKTIEIINDWCRIENDTEIGWIRINNLEKSITQGEIPENAEQMNEPVTEPTEDDNVETTTTATTLNKTGYVTVEGLTIRKGPKMSSEAIGGLSKNDQVEIIGEEDGWYKINLDEGYGYVSAKYISDTKVAETTSRSGNTISQPEISPMENTETANSTTEKDKTESTTSGESVVEYAKQYLGYKYVSGGTSPTTGFDCSGFTTYVYKHFGITLNRTSKDQIKNGVAVEKNNLQLGDIVLFNNESNTVIGHVGIYIGNNNFIHASNPSEGVKITSLSSSYYKIRYVGARRVI